MFTLPFLHWLFLVFCIMDFFLYPVKEQSQEFLKTSFARMDGWSFAAWTNCRKLIWLEILMSLCRPLFLFSVFIAPWSASTHFQGGPYDKDKQYEQKSSKYKHGTKCIDTRALTQTHTHKHLNNALQSPSSPAKHSQETQCTYVNIFASKQILTSTVKCMGKGNASMRKKRWNWERWS